jgi:hypothetical protein
VFEVTRITPPLVGASVSDPEPLYLNQEVTARFSGPVDPLSVTEESVRMTDELGRRVHGRLRVESHSVTFEPVAPVELSLEDGSFRPNQNYRLEVAGFPRASAVRSASGQVLERSIVRTFRAVSADCEPSPLLHSSIGPGFALEEGMLRMAENSHTLSLFFYEPPLPTTVTTEAFKLYRVRKSSADLVTEEFAPAAAKLVALPTTVPGIPGWVVELDLDRSPGFWLGVELSADPNVALRNYRGDLPRRVTWSADGQPRLDTLVGQKLLVEVLPGERVPLIREDFGERIEFVALRRGALTFEVRERKAMPRVRREAGSARLGVFAPNRSTTLEPGVPFDRGDGTSVISEGSVFEFLDVMIPRGVTVRLRSGPDGLVQLKIAGSFRLDGDLILVHTPLGVEPSRTRELTATELSSAASVIVIAGGDMEIRGRIVHEPRPGEAAKSGSPVTLLAGGDLFLTGARLPPLAVLATEPEGRLRGDAPASLNAIRVAPMIPELPAGTTLPVEAATGWYRIPLTPHGQIEIEAKGVQGDLRLHVQVAPADPSEPARPSADVRNTPVPLPLASPLTVPPGGFLRFVLEGRASAGAPLPAVESLVVVGV